MRGVLCFLARYWYAVAGSLLVMLASIHADRFEIGLVFVLGLFAALAS